MKFILLGAAGYIAPRHIQAIKDIGGDLVAICDPFDSVGVIDRYFPNCKYFPTFESLDRFAYKLTEPIDYVSIASPNWLHDPHARWALRIGATAICEKPLVLTERNLDGLLDMEAQTGCRVYGLYQLRYHQNAQKFKDALRPVNKISIDYQTPRGAWYDYSWKGYVRKSGGLETNIGSHLFDLCCSFLGAPETVEVIHKDDHESLGRVIFDKSVVHWHLSTKRGEPKRTFLVNETEIDFSGGFTDLHTEVYRQIVSGNGISIENHRESIKIAEEIRAHK